jgi:7,8-dihydroneopterin aldolase/epimerase/oxygenase
MMGAPRALIEAVAEDIAQRLLDKHALVNAVRLGIIKPHVCIAGHFQGMGIEIFRRRQDHTKAQYCMGV